MTFLEEEMALETPAPAETVGVSENPTRELTEKLRSHFVPPKDQLAWSGVGAVVLTEVAAPDSAHRADVVHVGLWASRGVGRIDVCEVKTSRADFRRELTDPGKVEAWWPYSTTFSIVAPSVEVAPPEELPMGWGLLVPQARGRRFKVVVKPEERTPKVTIELLIALLKCTETARTRDLRHQETGLRRQLAAQVQARSEMGRRAREFERIAERAAREAERLRRSLEGEA